MALLGDLIKLVQGELDALQRRKVSTLITMETTLTPTLTPTLTLTLTLALALTLALTRTRTRTRTLILTLTLNPVTCTKRWLCVAGFCRAKSQKRFLKCSSESRPSNSHARDEPPP